MQGNEEYMDRLEHALEAYAETLAADTLPKLKEYFHVYHSSYTALYQLMLRKGLVKEDPYRSDERVSGIAPPKDEPFLESEKDDQISMRLSRFDALLDYLTHYFSVALENLSLVEIKNIVGLIQYIKWTQLTETSNNPTTRAFAEAITKLKGAGDSLATSIVTDSHDQIVKASRSILGALKMVSEYRKELYKLELRRKVLPKMNLNTDAAGTGLDETLKKMRRVCAVEMKGVPFFHELAHETIMEDFGPDGTELREAVITRLEPEKKAAVEQKSEDYRPMLLETIRMIASSGRYLDQAVSKLVENNELFTHRKAGVAEILRNVLQRMMKRKPQRVTYSVEYVDESTSSKLHEQIQFEEFIEDARRRSRIFSGITGRVGKTQKALNSASEDQLLQFLQQNITDLIVAHRRIQSLDTFFRSELDREQRGQLTGVNSELVAIKDIVSRANKKRHEYVSRKDEQEQLRRLGVKT